MGERASLPVMDFTLNTPTEKLRERFNNLRTPRDVAALLEVPYSVLVYHLYRAPPNRRYTQFDIPKKSGGIRRISAPSDGLKALQSKLNLVLQAVYKPKPSTHGFTHKRNVLTNALPHAERKNVLNIDIHDFFPSINFGRVRGMFSARPYNLPPKVATVLAQICCFNNELPQGAPTSPIVSNMICAKLDSELQALAKRTQSTYTRYADDITFSNNSATIPASLAISLVSAPNGVQAGRELSHVITSNGFEINAQKVRLQFWNRRQEVTGLTVNNFPNTSRKYVRQIRAMLHAWEKYELAAAEQEHHLRYRKKYKAPFHKRPRYSDIVWGKLAYFASIRSPSNAIFKKLLSRYLKLTGQTVQPNTSLHPSKPDLAMASDALWVLECEESVSQGSAFYLEGVGLVTCAHVLGPKTKAFRHDNITVTYELEVVATNETIDLAILRFKTPPARLSTLKRGKSDLVEHLDEVFVWGFPNYRHGDSSIVSYGRVAGFRVVSTIKRIIVNAPIVEGSSGGPVLNKQGEVIGVAVTGAPSMKKAHETEDHGAIAISAIEHLLKK